MRAFHYVAAFVGFTCLISAAPLHAQAPTTGQANQVAVLVELPVAVARAAAAGVPADELRDIVRQLRDAEVRPAEAIDLIRFATVTEAARARRPEGAAGSPAVDAPGVRLSELIRERLADGVQGTRLADEIHRELRRQGVPVAAQRRGPRPLSPDFVPAEGRRPDRPGQSGRPGRQGPPEGAGQQGPPDRPGQQGPPDRPGQPGAQRPDAAGESSPRPSDRRPAGGGMTETDGGAA